MMFLNSSLINVINKRHFDTVTNYYLIVSTLRNFTDSKEISSGVHMFLYMYAYIRVYNSDTFKWRNNNCKEEVGIVNVIFV